MIPNKIDYVDVVSNISGESGQFSIDEASITKIISVLTNLYSDPELAVVREYLTNALDAQIEANEADPNYVWRPIEVTTPSAFSRSYVVRDFGIGMSGDDIKKIYSKYGKSTKETSNAMTGMLGLGSKCALTYTNQFTVTGYKNGISTKAIISKDEDDIPVFMIVDESPSDEPNGVEISVPVRDKNSFLEKTNHFLSFWKDGQVLVNGAEPKKHDYTEVRPGVHLVLNENSWTAPNSYIVMGNVPYLVDSEKVSNLSRHRVGFVAYVPMGAVSFPPSRETLHYDSKTNALINKIAKDDKIIDDYIDISLENIKKYNTPTEVLVAMTKLISKFNTRSVRSNTFKNFVYNGANFDFKFEFDCVEVHQYSAGMSVSVHKSIDYISIPNIKYIITGLPRLNKDCITPTLKKKISYFLRQKITTLIPNDSILFVENDIDSPWFSDIPRATWDDIKSIKLPRANVTKNPVPYDYWLIKNNDVSVESEVKINAPSGVSIVYVSPTDIKETYRSRGITPQQLIGFLGDKVYLTIISKNRQNKFCKEHPRAIPLSSYITNMFDEAVNKISKEEWVSRSISYSVRNYLAVVSIEDIKDESLAEIARLIQGVKTSAYDKMHKIFEVGRKCSVYLDIPSPTEVHENVISRYPLLENATTTDAEYREHMLFYINAIYDEKYSGLIHSENHDRLVEKRGEVNAV